MTTATETSFFRTNLTSLAKINVSMRMGHFTVKTIDSLAELTMAYALRAQVFQVEMIGNTDFSGVDTDRYDVMADHLAIMDERTQTLIATCRLMCSHFTKDFYSEQEFNCSSLLAKPEVKLEIGRVCIHPDFRKGAVLLMLWRAIGQYLVKADAGILFGCGSVMTQTADEAALIYRYLKSQEKVRELAGFSATEKYRFLDFEEALAQKKDQPLTLAESMLAKDLLPPLCQSYFDMGCYTPGHPALDREFKCIDFLTILERHQLDRRLRKKVLGEEGLA